MPPVVAVTDTLVMVPLRQIRPYQRNPRINEETVKRLVELIPKVGFNVPLVLDRQNVIVKGHSRWQAAVRLKLKALPCVYSDADEETIRLDRLADNRVQEFSTWDDGLLARELGALALPFEFDLGTLGFAAGTLPDPAAPASGRRRQTRTAGAAHETANGASQEPAPEPESETEGVPVETPPVSAAARAVDDGYIEVVCDKCGKPLFIKRPER